MKLRHLLVVALSAALTFGAVGQASAVVIDFEGLVAPSDQIGNVSPYTEDGFTLTIPGNPGSSHTLIAGAATITSNGTAVFGLCGSDVGTLCDGAPFTVTLTGAGTFSLTSIDFSTLSLFEDVGFIDVTGFFSGGGSILQTVDPPPALAIVPGPYPTFTFAGFTNLDSLDIMAQSVGPNIAIDNIVLNAAVPEPSSLLLLGSGLAGLAAWRWRKTRAATS